MKKWSLFALFLFVAALPAMAQDNPLTTTAKSMYDTAKTDLTKTAGQLPEDMYNYKPVDTVRSAGAILAHVADANMMMCSAAKEEKIDRPMYEKNAKTKADIQAALDKSFEYCDAVFADMNDAKAADLVNFFGGKRSRIGILDFNSAHDMEHYGNLVTYMRLKGMTPPSSQRN